MTEYFNDVNNRISDKVYRVLQALYDEKKMNKEELSLTSNAKHAVLDHVIMQLYALGLADVNYSEGKSKICSLTTLGEDYLKFLKPAI